MDGQKWLPERAGRFRGTCGQQNQDSDPESKIVYAAHIEGRGTGEEVHSFRDHEHGPGMSSHSDAGQIVPAKQSCWPDCAPYGEGSSLVFTLSPTLNSLQVQA